LLGISLRAAAGPNRTVAAPTQLRSSERQATSVAGSGVAGARADSKDITIGASNSSSGVLAAGVSAGVAGATGITLGQARGALQDCVATLQDLLFYLQDLLDLGVPALKEKTATFLVHHFIRPRVVEPLIEWHATVHMPIEAAAQALEAAHSASAMAAEEGDVGVAAAAAEAASAAAEKASNLSAFELHAPAATGLFVLTQV